MEGFIMYHKVLRHNYDLKPIECLVFGYVHGFNSDSKECYSSNQTIADEIGVGIDTIKRSIRILKSKGLIESVGGAKRTLRVQINPSRLKMHLVQNKPPIGCKISLSRVQIKPPIGGKLSHNKKEYNKSYNNSNNKVSSKEKENEKDLDNLEIETKDEEAISELVVNGYANGRTAKTSLSFYEPLLQRKNTIGERTETDSEVEEEEKRFHFVDGEPQNWDRYNPHGNNDKGILAIEIVRHMDKKRGSFNLSLLETPNGGLKQAKAKAQAIFSETLHLTTENNLSSLEVHKKAFYEILKIIDWMAVEPFIVSKPELLQFNMLAKGLNEFYVKANTAEKPCEFKEAFTSYWDKERGTPLIWDSNELKGIEGLKRYFNSLDLDNGLMLFNAVLQNMDSFDSKHIIMPSQIYNHRQKLTAKAKQKNERDNWNKRYTDINDPEIAGFIK